MSFDRCPPYNYTVSLNQRRAADNLWQVGILGLRRLLPRIPFTHVVLAVELAQGSRSSAAPVTPFRRSRLSSRLRASEIEPRKACSIFLIPS